jgi:hypothetical protein
MIELLLLLLGYHRPEFEMQYFDIRMAVAGTATI